MPKKIIELRHKVCDYTCMWNGIEDLYQTKLGEDIPDYFFFCLSGIGNFVYLKCSSGNVRRMAGFNDGRTKKMYASICDIVGFKYKHIEGRRFEYLMKKAKEQIDNERPVVLGCLDMYYLSYYPKFYYKEHIPIHYILMVGYDDEEQCAYVYDCGIKELQKIKYETLEKALNIEKTSLSDKNSICLIEFDDEIKSIREIAIKGFYEKANQMINPKVGFCGITGMRKLSKEILNWKDELTLQEYETVLRNITMFTGTVPILPNRLLMIEEKDEIEHQADRREYATLLIELGYKYGFQEWKVAGDLFKKSGIIIQEMTDLIVEYLLKESKELNRLPYMINEIANLEEKAYHKILEGIKNKA
ncbi:BtrH N-terminal domain-containing protein [Clostridium sp. MB40-C1]|uniref:BtrH N-terminal domain-containing protein n=1 Tax=Clostridium sp. MB40-C1 TaxID=3070996 RepID=UPI0027E0D513|nr:BtrH N-terminal domain-containing protein [Clostridium sp. MB40-C1]WMJ82243.1 BtrH N-terminal domain-containing protein [Clostridium sp. MB40-C1]